MKEFKILLPNGKEVECSAPTDKNVIRQNLLEFNNVANQIFADKKKYRNLFMSAEEFEDLKNNPKRLKELNIEII